MYDICKRHLLLLLAVINLAVVQGMLFAGDRPVVLRPTARFGTTDLRHPCEISTCAFIPDRQVLITTGAESLIRFWDIRTRRVIRQLDGRQGIVVACDCSNDGNYLIAAGGDKTAKIWRLAQSAPVLTLQHKSQVNCVAFSADVRFALTGCSDSSIHVYDVLKHKEKAVIQLSDRPVLDAVFLKGNSSMIACDLGGQVRLLSLATQTTPTKISCSYRVKRLCASPDGTTILLVGDSNELAGVSGNNLEPKPIYRQSRAIVNATFTSNESIAVSDDLGYIVLYNIAQKKVLKRFRACTSFVQALSFDKSTSTLAVATWNAVRLWDVNSGKELDPASGHFAEIRSTRFSNDEKTLAFGSLDGKLSIINIPERKLVKTIDANCGSVLALDVMPQSGRVVVGGKNGTVVIYRSEDGMECKQLRIGNEDVDSVSCSRDGKIVAFGARTCGRLLRFGVV